MYPLDILLIYQIRISSTDLLGNIETVSSFKVEGRTGIRVDTQTVNGGGCYDQTTIEFVVVWFRLESKGEIRPEEGIRPGP